MYIMFLCKINGIQADFIFDTGAGMISLSSSFAQSLYYKGLSESDFWVRECQE